MSKLWEAIKDLERERDNATESGAIREGSRQALATYLEEIRLRPRERVSAASELMPQPNKRR